MPQQIEISGDDPEHTIVTNLSEYQKTLGLRCSGHGLDLSAHDPNQSIVKSPMDWLLDQQPTKKPRKGLGR